MSRICMKKEMHNIIMCMTIMYDVYGKGDLLHCYDLCTILAGWFIQFMYEV